MSFVGPWPDVPGSADKLVGDDRDVLKLVLGTHWIRDSRLLTRPAVSVFGDASC